MRTKLIFLLILSTGLKSCKTDSTDTKSTEIQTLQNRVIELELMNKKLFQQLEKCNDLEWWYAHLEKRAILSLDQTIIKRGKSVGGNLGMFANISTENRDAQVRFKINGQSQNSNFKYSDSLRMFKFNFTPKDEGKYLIDGYLIKKVREGTMEYHFEQQIEVIK